MLSTLSGNGHYYRKLAPTAPLERSWYRQAFIWLPAGIVTGLLAAAFILRILRRLQSPATVSVMR